MARWLGGQSDLMSPWLRLFDHEANVDIWDFQHRYKSELNTLLKILRLLRHQ